MKVSKINFRILISFSLFVVVLPILNDFPFSQIVSEGDIMSFDLTKIHFSSRINQHARVFKVFESSGKVTFLRLLEIDKHFCSFQC